jgi:hypothetical protein
MGEDDGSCDRSGSGGRASGGFVVAVYAPDGAGKTTLVRALAERLEQEFSGVTYWHLLEHQPPGYMSVPVVEPHGQPSRSSLASSAKVVYYLGRAWLHRWPRVWRGARRAGRLVIIDRDLADPAIDPDRYRMRGPQWLLDLIFVEIRPEARHGAGASSEPRDDTWAES